MYIEGGRFQIKMKKTSKFCNIWLQFKTPRKILQKKKTKETAIVE